ncbi:MAG TPA: methyltransferase [Bacteroidales bacterium]|nr:methyltransferase [Bacteroidales bacterium]
MANSYFSFKQFTIYQDKCAFKVGTDGVLLGAYTDISSAARILDIGTGSGLIALMLAQRCEAVITAIEPDPESFNQACINIEGCKWNNRIKAENISLQNFFIGDDKFDLLVTNPPYFTDSLKNPDPGKAAARHNFLLGNDDLLKGVRRLLSEEGKFQLILPYPEANVFIAEAQAYGFYCNDILKIRPLPDSEIRRMILTFTNQRQKVKEKFLTIEHGKRHDFTKEYINLTREFYLKF